MRLIVLGALLAAAVAACSTSGSSYPEDASGTGDENPAPFGGPYADPLDSDAALPLRVMSIFRACAGGPESYCHGSNAGNTRLSLGPDGGDLIGVPSFERPDMARVEPGRPERSYLVLKLTGDGGIDGGRMPLGGPFDERIERIVADWVEAGAMLP